MTMPVVVVAQSLSFKVEQFAIDGPNPLNAERTQSLLAPFLGAHEDLERLQDAAQTLEKEIRAEGYAFYRVHLPPQTLDGAIVNLKVTAYGVQSIRIEGQKHHSRDNILASLPALSEGVSPNVKQLSRQLTVANENPSKNVETRFAVDPGTGELQARLQVSDQHPVSVFSWLDNSGSDVSGDYRLGVGVQHTNAFSRDHLVTSTFTTSPSRPSDVQQFGIDYKIPLYRHQAELGLVGATSTVDTGEIAEAFDVRGSGDVYGLRLRRVLPRLGDYRQSLQVSLFDKSFDNDIRFIDTPIGNTVRSRPFALTYTGLKLFDKASFSFDAGVTTNISGGSNNDDASYATVREGASSDWSVFQAGANMAMQLNRWAVLGMANVQFSNDTLIPGEQIAIGGLRTIRGFQESEVAGDQGLRLGVELWTPEIKPGLRLLGFADYGRIRSNHPLDGENRSDDIASLGVGVRFDWRGAFNARLDLGHVIEGVDNNLTESTEDGDTRVHFSLTYRFKRKQ